MSTIVTGSSGTTYITGSGTSDFDSAALISVAVEAKMAAAYLLDDQIDVLDDQVSAYEEMQTDLQSLSDAAATLSSDADDSVFAERASYLSSSTISSPDDVIGVTVTTDAALGSYQVVVNSIAVSEKVASDEVSDKTTALGYAGVFSLVEDGYDGADITITSDMSLEDIADAINAVSDDTGVTATLVKTSDSGYTLSLAGADTGKSLTASTVSGDDVLQSLGVTDSSGDFANVLQEATQASITIDGLTVTSTSNDIEDVLPGVSISLYSDSDGDTITLEVGQSLDDIESAISDLVDAYNTYRTFALTNQETDDDGAADTAVLFGERLLRQANSTLSSLLSTSVDVDGTTYTLASLGITLDDDNSLSIDSDTLENMLIQHPDVVQAFFQQSATTSSTDLGVTDMPGDMATGDYTVEVTMADDGSVASATINGVALTINGRSLTGASGSIYEGLTMVYTGSSDASLTVSVEAGFADSTVAALDTFVDDDDGLIAQKLDSLNSTIDTKQDKRDSIADAADDYETYLVDYYAKLEAEIEASETALKQIEALFYSDSDSSSS